jgi:hypothetical protein
LFVAYGGGLFAQDEMQVAEMPSLGHLKEALDHTCTNGDPLMPFTRIQDVPTPILIRNIERRCKVFTDVNVAQGRPRGLYGNAFAGAS